MSAHPHSDTDDVDLSPSAKFVVFVLEGANGGLTPAELQNKTDLASSTVRDALRRLEEYDIVESEPSFADARQDRYFLKVN